MQVNNKNQLSSFYGFEQVEFITEMTYQSRYFRALNRNERIDQFLEYGFNQSDLVANQRQFSEHITLRTKQSSIELILMVLNMAINY